MRDDDLELIRSLCRDAAAFEQLMAVIGRWDRREDGTLATDHRRQHAQVQESQGQPAEAASQTKNRFLAMISHELRTPLNSILGLSELLLRQVVGPLTPKQLEYLNYIHGSGEHLLAIIGDILDLSKVEAGQEHLRLSRVSLPDLCQSCVAMVQPRATEKSLALSHRVAEDAADCVADERRLRQMLLNLLSNAIKFTPQGQVVLTVHRQGNWMDFWVEDTGIGIPEDQLEQIFQPFTQIDGDLNRRYEGTGLGLALTRQLARLHGGDLQVESTVGRGSRFCLRLPRAGDGGDRTPAAPATAASPRHPTHHQLVVIDADLDHHQALLAYVTACGWQATSYRCWADLHSHLQNHWPHLVIVGDREATNPDLLQHLQQLRRAPQLLRVAVLSADPNPILDRLLAQSCGVDARIALPLTIPKLERLLSL